MRGIHVGMSAGQGKTEARVVIEKDKEMPQGIGQKMNQKDEIEETLEVTVDTDKKRRGIEEGVTTAPTAVVAKIERKSIIVDTHQAHRTQVVTTEDAGIIRIAKVGISTQDAQTITLTMRDEKQ